MSIERTEEETLHGGKRMVPPSIQKENLEEECD
jgi:hypothetical protein